MSAIAVSCITFICIAGGVLLGMFLRNTLAEHHLSNDAKDVVRLGTGLIGTIAALVLGLLIASAKGSYDTQSTQIKQMTANVVLLDRLLAQYGPETGAIRGLLRRGIAILADRMWRENSSDRAKAGPFEASDASEAFYAKLQELSPQNDSQRSLQARTIQVSTDIAQARLLLFAQTDNSIPMPFLVVLIFWLTIIFASFSLFARPNAIVIGSLLIFALSAAGAIYLILELGQPFAGLMQISRAPLRNALTPLGS
jgi:flagellar biosynthesis component FlhA